MPVAPTSLRALRAAAGSAGIAGASLASFACATILAAAGAASVPSPEERARAVLAASRFQRALPSRPDPELPGWMFPFLMWLADLSHLLLLAGALIAVGALVYAASRWWASRRPTVPAAAPAEEPFGGIGAAGNLAEAEELAALGRFDEAVHLLLLAAIDRVFGATGRRPPRAATSRELARQVATGGQAEGSFAAIVALVERSLFGERALTRADWDAGRAAWDGLERGR